MLCLMTVSPANHDVTPIPVTLRQRHVTATYLFPDKGLHAPPPHSSPLQQNVLNNCLLSAIRRHSLHRSHILIIIQRSTGLLSTVRWQCTSVILNIEYTQRLNLVSYSIGTSNSQVLLPRYMLLQQLDLSIS